MNDFEEHFVDDFNPDPHYTPTPSKWDCFVEICIYLVCFITFILFIVGVCYLGIQIHNSPIQETAKCAMPS